MVSNPQIHICYSGSLDGYKPTPSDSKAVSFAQYFWTYKHNNVDSSTRSGYFLIRAIEILKNKYSIKPEQLKVSLWGMINEINIQQIKEHGLEQYFDISGYLPKEESLKKLKTATLLFLPLEKSNIQGQGTLFIPGKLYEYIKMQKPVLALCEPSDCMDILIKSGLGIFAKPDSPKAIAEMLFKIIEDRLVLAKMTPNREYIEEFSFERKSEELSDIFKIMLDNNS